MRLQSDRLAPNTGAGDLVSAADPRAVRMREAFAKRARNVMQSNAAGEDMSDGIKARIDHWVAQATQPGRTLGYERKSRQGEVVPLLQRPGARPWDITTVPTSMREVESGVRLIMDKRRLSPAELQCAPWEHRTDGDGGGGDGNGKEA